jgi:SAM-dependent methyltransferase
LGFKPSNLFGIDIQEARIAKAKSKNPLITFQCIDATRQDYADNTFDIVMESGLFIHLTDEALAKQVAFEMLRVTKMGGALILADWRYPKLGNHNYKAVSMRRIKRLFGVGTHSIIHKTFRGPLIPPVGRFLSTYWSAPYFLVHALFPFLAGHTVTVLKKVGP